MATETGSLTFELNVQDTIDVLLEPVLTDGLFTDSFDVIKNFYGGEYKIGLLEAMENITNRQSGCSPVYTGVSAMSERSLRANYLESPISFCWDVFKNTQYDKLAPFFTNQNGVADARPIISLLSQLMGSAIKRDVERFAWFGDQSSTNEAINKADGVFKYVNELITTNQIGYRVDSTQGTLLTNAAAYALLKNVVSNAPAALRSIKNTDKRIHINGELWQQICNYLEEVSITNGFIKIFESPTSDVIATYRGIPIVVHETWDDVSFRYFDEAVHQNKIIYTPLSNLKLATDLRVNASNGSASFESYQDPKTKEIFLNAKFILAVDYVWPVLFSVAF